MTPSQQAVEAALNHFDDPETVWHGPGGEKGRTLAAEVRRLREENARLQSSAHAAHGLLSPLGNQVTPSVLAIRETLQILRRMQ